MNKIPKNQNGFSAVELIMIIVIVVLIGAVGYLVYKNHHKTPAVAATTISTTKPTSSTKSTTAATTQPANPYAGWKNICDSQSNTCMYYPSTWSATNNQGGVFISSPDSGNVAVSEDAEPSDCSSLQPSSSQLDQFYVNTINSVTSGSLKLDVVGGYYIKQAPTYIPGDYPSYILTSVANVDKYNLKVGSTVTFPDGWTCYDYGVISGEANTEILGSDKYNSTAQDALSWFATDDAVNSLKVLQSVYTD